MTSEGWKVSMLDSSPGDDGGYKNVVLEVTGDSVYSKLKWEAGVHRVQRVPATEAQGRVHTSTATVAIMVRGFFLCYARVCLRPAAPAPPKGLGRATRGRGIRSLPTPFPNNTDIYVAFLLLPPMIILCDIEN